MATTITWTISQLDCKPQEDGETDVELEDPNEMEDYYYNEDEILESQPSKEEIITEIEYHLSEITELLKILK